MDGRARRRLRVLLLHAERAGAGTLSYYTGWPKAFLRHPRFAAEPVDVTRRGWRFARAARSKDFDAVVVLHSVFSNEPYLVGRSFRAVARMPQPKAWFLANEFKDMPARMRFADELGVSLLVTQSTLPEVHRLYANRFPGAHVAGIVNAGVDLDVFFPRTPPDARPIDIGYRSYAAPLYLGHVERTAIAEHVAARGGDLRLDLSVDPADRMAPPEWGAFLDRCRGQLGCEAGTDFLELDDASRLRVNAFLEERPDASFEEVYDRFFRDYGPRVSGRVLSGRIAEAAASSTVQILVEGEYGGYFRPDEHYIPVRKDFSNVDEALEKFRDRALSAETAARAREVADTELRFERLLDTFADELAAVL